MSAADLPAGAIARLLDLTERRVQQLAKEGVIPKSSRGRYPLAGAVRGYIRFLQQTGVGMVNDPDQLKPFERKAHYQAEHAKLLLQVERGELVPALEVERGHGQIFAISTQMADTLPDVLERDVGLSPLQLARVEKHLDEWREALYQRLVEDKEDDGADSAASDRA